MKSYYVESVSQENGHHLVHKDGCDWIPQEKNKVYLGEFKCCEEAIEEAQDLFNDLDRCIQCLTECISS